MGKRLTLWIIVLLTLVAIWVDVPKFSSNVVVPGTKISFNTANLLDKFPIKLGLDLQGGTQLVLQAQMDKLPADQRDNALESARQVIERRVNLFGVSESVVQSSKLGNERRILVDLPGVKDASAAANLVGRTAQLEFRQLPATASATASQSGDLEQTGLTGADLKSSSVVFSSGGRGEPQVSIVFTDAGAKKFADITRNNVGKPLAIFLDNELVTAPVVQQEIIGGSAVINGQFTVASAKQLSIQLNAGALPVPILILEQRSIGATLGQESIDKSIVAALVGLLTVMLYMAAYYGKRGVIADLALIIYTLFVFAIFKTGLIILPPVTLTLAGIAGFVLSIGMAVDANILIFERMNEEARWGKSPRVALELGFKRAWSSIRDSNTSSLITALILYFFGTGPVRGFAITLAIGVLVSMFTAVVVTRTFLRLAIK